MGQESVGQEKQKYVREQYDQSAGIYNNRYRAVQREKFEISIPDSLSLDLPNQLILDIGCGTGLLGEYLSSRVPGGNVSIVGIDISPKMIKQARRLGMYNCVIADISALPVRDCRFKVVMSYTAFQNLPDWQEGIQEMFRILELGGVFMASILKTSIEPGDFFAFLAQGSRLDAEIQASHSEDCIARGIKHK